MINTNIKIKENFKIFFFECNVKLIEKESIINFFNNLNPYYNLINNKDMCDINLMLMNCENLNENIINQFLWFLINKNLLNFKLYFVYLKNHINNHYINVLKLIYSQNLIKKVFKNYKIINNFFKNHKKFKNLFNNLLIEKNYEGTQTVNQKNMIKISKYHSLNIKLSKLLNILSIFGFITNLYYNFLDGNIFLEYKHFHELLRILKNKSKLVLNNQLIELEPYYISISCLKELNLIQNLKINKNINRYIENNNVKYNSPSSILIISNININTKLFKIFKIICYYCKPLLIKEKILKKGDSKIGWIKLNNISDSINLIINMNNLIINKKKIKVAFSFNKFKI